MGASRSCRAKCEYLTGKSGTTQTYNPSVQDCVRTSLRYFIGLPDGMIYRCCGTHYCDGKTASDKYVSNSSLCVFLFLLYSILRNNWFFVAQHSDAIVGGD